jgi:hypothetical protein
MDLVDERTRCQRVADIDKSFVGSAFERQLVRQSDGSIVICVDNTGNDDAGVNVVQRELTSQSLSLPGYGSDVPLSWLKFLDQMADLVNEDTCHLSFADARDIALRCHVGAQDDTPDKELLLMLRLNTCFGLLMHFDEPQLKDLVILKVQWLLDVMAAMLCRRQLSEKLNGASALLPVSHKSFKPHCLYS